MTIALSATLREGCQNEDTACLNGAETMVRICTTVVTPHTRTTTSPYVGSDLSLSIISANDNFTYTNIKWQSSSDAVSSGWSPATPMRWENATNPVSLYAYAPHSSAVSDITAIPFSVAADQATEGIVPSDLLGFSINSFVPARGEVGLNAEGELPIVLPHRLSPFRLRLRMHTEW